jgi:hypothetical protein
MPADANAVRPPAVPMESVGKIDTDQLRAMSRGEAPAMVRDGQARHPHWRSNPKMRARLDQTAKRANAHKDVNPSGGQNG